MKLSHDDFDCQGLAAHVRAGLMLASTHISQHQAPSNKALALTAIDRWQMLLLLKIVARHRHQLEIRRSQQHEKCPW
jgi:hypothetical protein